MLYANALAIRHCERKLESGRNMKKMSFRSYNVCCNYGTIQRFIFLFCSISFILLLIKFHFQFTRKSMLLLFYFIFWKLYALLRLHTLYNWNWWGIRNTLVHWILRALIYFRWCIIIFVHVITSNRKSLQTNNGFDACYNLKCIFLCCCCCCSLQTFPICHRVETRDNTTQNELYRTYELLTNTPFANTCFYTHWSNLNFLLITK